LHAEYVAAAGSAATFVALVALVTAFVVQDAQDTAA
jgi:uncharacterized membrane protein